MNQAIPKEISISHIDINLLNPAPYNPRQASEEEYHQLKESINKFGLIDPLLVNAAPSRENVVIGGHFRLKIAKDMGFKTIPVVYINIPDIEKEKELNLRLNRNTGSWDFDTLANMDEEMLKSIGFKDSDFGKFDTISPDELDASLKEKPGFQQMVFIVHDSQIENIKSAIKKAKEGNYKISENNDNDGNALSCICKRFLNV